MGTKRKIAKINEAIEDSDSDYEVDRYVKPKINKVQAEPETESDEDEVEQTPQKSNRDITKNEIQELLKDRTSKRFVLCVDNVDFKSTKEEIEHHFSTVGAVKSVRVPKHRKSAFAFVEMKDIDSLHRSFSLNNSILNGRQIKVKLSEGGTKKTESKKKKLEQRNRKIMKIRHENNPQGEVLPVAVKLPEALEDPKISGLGKGSFSGPHLPPGVEKSRSGKTTLYHPSKKKKQALKNKYKKNKMLRRKNGKRGSV